MRNLLIIGARAFGRETYFLATLCRGYNLEYRIKGFLDDNPHALDGYKGYPEILSSVEEYKVQPGDLFICALGDPIYKKYYAKMTLDKGGEFISLVHPTVNIHQNVKVGIGCVIKNGVNLSCDVEVGNFVTILPYSVIGHDAKIGDWCQLNTYSFMGGFSKIGEMVTISTGGIILPHVEVKDNSIIGAGSVAISNVKENTTVIGVPAKKLKF